MTVPGGGLAGWSVALKKDLSLRHAERVSLNLPVDLLHKAAIGMNMVLYSPFCIVKDWIGFHKDMSIISEARGVA